jgi:hypothetical protein
MLVMMRRTAIPWLRFVIIYGIGAGVVYSITPTPYSHPVFDSAPDLLDPSTTFFRLGQVNAVLAGGFLTTLASIPFLRAHGSG